MRFQSSHGSKVGLVLCVGCLDKLSIYNSGFSGISDPDPLRCFLLVFMTQLYIHNLLCCY